MIPEAYDEIKAAVVSRRPNKHFFIFGNRLGFAAYAKMEAPRCKKTKKTQNENKKDIKKDVKNIRKTTPAIKNHPTNLEKNRQMISIQ